MDFISGRVTNSIITKISSPERQKCNVTRGNLTYTYHKASHTTRHDVIVKFQEFTLLFQSVGRKSYSILVAQSKRRSPLSARTVPCPLHLIYIYPFHRTVKFDSLYNTCIALSAYIMKSPQSPHIIIFPYFDLSQ